VQFAAETQHGLVAAVAVTNSGADQDALDAMHAKVTQTYERHRTTGWSMAAMSRKTASRR